ncbi:MAG: packaged DNA stabilization protein [Thiohalomonadales bacterium]
MRKQVNLLRGDKKGKNTEYRDSLPVNMSAVIKPMFGAAGYMLQQPGLTIHATGSGKDRGGLWNERQKNHYRVSGTEFISIDSSGGITFLGNVPGIDKASMPYSFNTQAVIANGQMWLYNGATFIEVTDPDLGNPISCVWIDQYYFLTDGEYIYHTDIADETAIDPLQFATAEFSPDPTLAVDKTTDDKAVVFGRYSIEYFANVASSNFAFTRINSRAVKAGIVGSNCKTEMGGAFYIMGGRKEEDISIHVVGVGDISKIGSREVDKLIGQYTELELSDASLEARTEDGIMYLIVHLPNETLLFNADIAKQSGASQAWSILQTDITGNSQWRAINGTFLPTLGNWVYGDKIDGSIGILDETVATHYGEIARWELSTPFLKLETLSIDELEIETIPGYTTTKDATVSISLTYDGVTYGKEWFKMYGMPSDYGARFILYSLGYIPNWVGFKFRGSTKSRMAFSAATIEVG